MASMTSTPANHPNAKRVIQFLCGGKRWTVSLGKMEIEPANLIKERIESILQNKERGESHNADTLKWIRRHRRQVAWQARGCRSIRFSRVCQARHSWSLDSPLHRSRQKSEARLEGSVATRRSVIDQVF